MTTISPSILAADFMDLKSDVDALSGINDLWLHLDVMDGHFVPNMTFGIPIIKQLSNITSIPLDVHLMVTNPNFHIIELKDINIQNITFHLEAESNPLKLVELAKQFYPSVGISIKPGTSVSEIDIDLLSHVDLVLVMSVEPGFGGQKFMDSSLEKMKELTELRDLHSLDFKIQIDGGVNLETSKKAIAAGADNLVAGSYIFKNSKESYSEIINTLR
ncbi:MAG: ribulose-phosphate 3-epimerase [Bacteriovorax sp. MedPE-SWde]|nr:MAG: ribulose-phosphate 3-epimerase [Bacteriovorax sp. MedPE-SWde]